MNCHAIHHEAKSKYAYAFDNSTLHIRLRTAKNDVTAVTMIWGDPFNWRRLTEEEHAAQAADGDFIQTHTWAHAPEAPMPMIKDYSDQYFDYWFIEVLPEYKRTRYAFILEDHEKFATSTQTPEQTPEQTPQQVTQPQLFFGAHGAVDMAKHPEILKSLSDYFNFPYLNKEDVFVAPAWVKETVWYQIFPERFANGDASINKAKTLPWGSELEVTNDMHFGGDLQGVIDHLDYIADLGATGIYFTPIFEAPTTHKYDTIDYFKIDPEFGTNETFKTLVDEAHKRGIKVMLDAVFNHCGFKHPYFQDVVKHGFDSKYAQCFHLLREPVINFPIGDNGLPAPKSYMPAGLLNYETFAFTPNMPKWRTENPVAEQHLMDVATYWIKNYDIDGWRLDVSNEVSHVFWRKFKNIVRAIKPDVFILGENWDDSNPWLRGDQFDSVMNYEFTYPVWHLLSREPEFADFGAQAFKDSISRLLVSYPKHIAANLFNLLDSHDTSRLRTMLSGDDRLVKLAFVLQMSFGGSPSVYYGSEVGLSGVHDGNRQCMVWDEAKQNLDLKAHVKRMIALRREHAALRAMDMKWLDTDLDTGVMAFRKTSDDKSLTFLFNFSEELREINVFDTAGPLKYDVYTGRTLALEAQNQIVLEPFSFRIYG